MLLLAELNRRWKAGCKIPKESKAFHFWWEKKSCCNPMKPAGDVFRCVALNDIVLQLLLSSQKCCCHIHTVYQRRVWHLTGHVRGMTVMFLHEWSSVLRLVRGGVKRYCWVEGVGKELRLVTVIDWLYRCRMYDFAPECSSTQPGLWAFPHHANTSNTSNTSLFLEFCSSEAKWTQEG